MLRKLFATAFVLLAVTAGCTGNQETILPTDPLSPEQQEAIKAEDSAVADEEGGER